MKFGYTKDYLTRRNRPWFPVVGEVHYSRIPASEWEDALYKMMMGGVCVASCDVIWIHHEEVRGEWDFRGRKDLRRFVQTCKACGLKLFLRIGPWCHGGVRNGGFPDWLLNGNCIPRTNDEGYLAQVARYYRMLFCQVEGLLHKDGGPIIGVRIENEYGHGGGLRGQEGERHMQTLAWLARDAGFDVPLFTAPGWCGAVTGGLLPVMGDYREAPWDAEMTESRHSINDVFMPLRNFPGSGLNNGKEEERTLDAERFPFLMAEMGSELQVTRHRRPVATGKDTAARSVVKLGSGANLLGYSLYHGGVNPSGKHTALQECRETGDPDDVPVWSSDSGAPLGAYGQYRSAYHELRMLALFAVDFGEELCRMPPVFSPDNPQDPGDNTRLRYSFRMNSAGAGYVFFCNYVRHMVRPDFRDVRLVVPGTGKVLPPLFIPAGTFGFYPFDMPVEGGVIRFAQATPLCRVGQTTVLYGESVDATPGAQALLITREEALQAYKITLDREYLVLSGNPVLEGPGGYRILASTPELSLRVYPPLPKVPEGFTYRGVKKGFACYHKVLPFRQPACAIHRIGERRYRLCPADNQEADDYHLYIRYRADRATVYIHGKPVMDDFWTDGEFCVGLKRHGFPTALEVELEPLSQSAPVDLDQWPAMDGGCVCALDGVGVERILQVPLSFGETRFICCRRDDHDGCICAGDSEKTL